MKLITEINIAIEDSNYRYGNNHLGAYKRLAINKLNQEDAMSISNGQELDERIQNFLESKLKRFPDIANMNVEQGRSSLTLKNRADTSAWLPKDTRTGR